MAQLSSAIRAEQFYKIFCSVVPGGKPRERRGRCALQSPSDLPSKRGPAARWRKKLCRLSRVTVTWRAGLNGGRPDLSNHLSLSEIRSGHSDGVIHVNLSMK